MNVIERRVERSFIGFLEGYVEFIARILAFIFHPKVFRIILAASAFFSFAAFLYVSWATLSTLVTCDRTPIFVQRCKSTDPDYSECKTHFNNTKLPSFTNQGIVVAEKIIADKYLSPAVVDVIESLLAIPNSTFYPPPPHTTSTAERLIVPIDLTPPLATIIQYATVFTKPLLEQLNLTTSPLYLSRLEASFVLPGAVDEQIPSTQQEEVDGEVLIISVTLRELYRGMGSKLIWPATHIRTGKWRTCNYYSYTAPCFAHFHLCPRKLSAYPRGSILVTSPNIWTKGTTNSDQRVNSMLHFGFRVRTNATTITKTNERTWVKEKYANITFTDILQDTDPWKTVIGNSHQDATAKVVNTEDLESALISQFSESLEAVYTSFLPLIGAPLRLFWFCDDMGILSNADCVWRTGEWLIEKITRYKRWEVYCPGCSECSYLECPMCVTICIPTCIALFFTTGIPCIMITALGVPICIYKFYQRIRRRLDKALSKKAAGN